VLNPQCLSDPNRSATPTCTLYAGEPNLSGNQRREGLSRRRPFVSTQPVRGKGFFTDYDLAFIHIDIKQLPNLQTANGEWCKCYLHVAIDHRSWSVHLVVKDDETEKSAIAFLRELTAAFPFRLTHVLTDNGSRFTPAFEKACAQRSATYRHTKPACHRSMAGRTLQRPYRQ
jgi:Integrase core domain